MLRYNTLFTLLFTISMSVTCAANPVIPIPNQPSSTPHNNSIIPIPTQHQGAIITPTAPNLDATGYILIDASSGKVLAEKNSDKRVAPASLTKLMTMYVISNAIKNNSIRLDDKVRISAKAWQTGGSRMFIKANDEVPVRDLLKGIVIASGNDASVAMSEYIAGTEEAFASVMNSEAQALGMTNSHFIDSNGLPNPQHYTTARDLAILAMAIIKNFPEDYRLYSEKWFTYNGIRQPNRNRLLWRFPLADGLKTGHTQEAGYCLVSSAIKDGTRLIGVLMGASNDQARTEDSIRLLTYGFRFFETHKLYKAGATLGTARVWKGQQKEIPLGLTDDLYVTMPIGQFKKIEARVDIPTTLKAPIKKGEAYGTLEIVLNNQVLASKPLIALASSNKGGIWRSITDAIGFTFHKLFTKSTEKANNG